ncbi:Reticulocyte-binding protein 2 a [Folsomia candida]|uniref:Reticulocyte-binding protein 2 a n=1 Tax=Folsomia candida TaxID=158441 RepID=A0A226DBW0_FOLCA|nr:Reticulocyte-binding protein 2 a [Folsomia candida]
MLILSLKLNILQIKYLVKCQWLEISMLSRCYLLTIKTYYYYYYMVMACFGIDADDASASTPFGKVGCSEAEELLEGCGLPRDSPGSRAALRKYCEEQEGRNVSLLECGLEQLVKEQKDSVSSERRRDADCEDDNLVSSSYQKPCHVRSKGIEEVVFARNSTDKVKAGVEERLHAIQIGLEKDKNIQLQMAINNFREKEEAKIRQELETRMEFELLSKEKELLSVAKERAEVFREALAAEKAAWEEEKEREERRLAERRKKQLDQEKEEAKTARSPRPRPTEIESAKSQELLPTRDYQHYPVPPPNNRRDPISEMDRDKIAFLQYNLEQQSQEIRDLRQQLHGTTNLQQAPPPSTSSLTDLVHFLSASKKRCLVIEEESRRVDSKLTELRASRSKPLPLDLKNRRPTQAAQAASTLISRLSLLNPPLLHPVITPLNIPLLPPSFYQLSSSNNKVPTPAQTPTRSNHPQETPKSPKKVSADLSPISQKSVTSLPENSSALTKVQNEFKLAKALSGGALSFEKVLTSSSEAEELTPKKSPQQSSTARLMKSPPPHSAQSTSTSAIRRRISFSDDNRVENDDDHDKGEEPVKLLPDNDINTNSERSLSISQLSGPKSRGGGDDSDFWNL